MSAPVTIQHDLETRLATGLKLYAKAAGKTIDQVVREKSGVGKGCFQSVFRSELKKISPAKGAIRSERIAKLKAGEGVHVRSSVVNWLANNYKPVYSLALKTTLLNVRSGKKQKGKKIVALAGRVLDPDSGKLVNFQALAVKRELNIREAGRGFTAQTAKLLTGAKAPMPDEALSTSRQGLPLAVGTTVSDIAHTSVMFKWGGFSELSDQAVQALGRVKGQRAINSTLLEVVADMIPFIERKLGPEAAALLK